MTSGTGTCTVTASRDADNDYNAANVKSFVNAAKANQTIATPFTVTPSSPVYALNGTFTVSTTASSGLAVNFSTSTGTVCSVSGNTVTTLSAGTCIINADQPGNDNYLAAGQQTQTVTIGKGAQTI